MSLRLEPLEIELNERDLADFEKAIGQSIPDEYVRFLRRYNGAIPTPNTFMCGEVRVDIWKFFPASSEGTDNLIGDNRFLGELLLPHYLSLAITDYGHRLCVDLRDDSFHLWEGSLNDERPEDGMVFVTASFQDFLSSHLSEGLQK